MILLLLCIITSVYGILMVHSATRNHLLNGLPFSRDSLLLSVVLLVGIVLALVISFIDYELIVKLWPFIGGVCLLMMLLLFVIGKGPAGRADVKSWIILGPLSFQPSEICKIGFIITFAVHLDAVSDKLNKFTTVLLLAVHGMIPLGLVILTGDLGSGLVFAFIFVSMMFIAGIKLRYFALAGVLGLIAAPIAWVFFLSDFQKNRLLAVYYPAGMPEQAYKDIIMQQNRGIYAIGSGGFTGTGLFDGMYTAKELVPERKNDMILSVVGEELGFLGAIALLLLLALIVFKIILLGIEVKNPVGKMICFGSSMMLAAQTIINIGMCLKLLPVIGITLPFFSAGGSSNLCIYLLIGLILSIYRSTRERAPVNFRLTHGRAPFSTVG